MMDATTRRRSPRSGNAPTITSTNNDVYTINDEKDIKSHQEDDDDDDGVKKSTPSRVLSIIIRLVRPILMVALCVNIIHKSCRLLKVYKAFKLLAADEGRDVNSAHLRSRVLGELTPQVMERFNLHPKNSDEELKQHIDLHSNPEGRRPGMVDMIKRVKEEVKLPFDVVYDEETKEYKTVPQEEREYEVIVDRPKNSQKEYKVVVDKPKKKKTAGSSDIGDLTKIDKPAAKKKPQQSKPDVKAIEKKNKPTTKKKESPLQKPKPVNVKIQEKGNKPTKKKETPGNKPMNQDKGIGKQKPAPINDKKKQPTVAAAKDVKGKEKTTMKNDKDKGSFKKMKKL